MRWRSQGQTVGEAVTQVPVVQRDIFKRCSVGGREWAVEVRSPLTVHRIAQQGVWEKSLHPQILTCLGTKGDPLKLVLTGDKVLKWERRSH